ncbi:MAG: lysophospholipid acyltransferase family protein [Thermoanaerobaculales bacterium]
MRTAATNRREYRLYQAALAVSNRLPFWLLQQLGAAVGVGYLLLSSRRATVFGNLRRVFPQRSRIWRLRIGLQCAAHFGSVAFDYLKWSQASAETLDANVKVTGVENLREAVARGKGAFVLSAHFGHWEVAALWMAAHGLRQTVVIRPLDNPLLEAELAVARTRFGNELIPKHGATRGMLKALRRGGIIDILLDQKTDLDQCVVVDFLGIPTPTVQSLAKMVLATGAAVVPLFTFPRGSCYDVRIDPALPVASEDTPTTLTARYNAVVSREILARPELWLWFHNRWTPRSRRGFRPQSTNDASAPETKSDEAVR